LKPLLPAGLPSIFRNVSPNKEMVVAPARPPSIALANFIVQSFRKEIKTKEVPSAVFLCYYLTCRLVFFGHKDECPAFAQQGPT
jgi:hypothetical protein